jgi:serine/threonine protein kinase
MGVRFGKYQLLKKIASGGMGQVFLALDGTQGFEKLVVIKRLLPHLAEDKEFLSMFDDEARIAARLNHPNLIQIFERGRVEDSYYLGMEYVAGENLRHLERDAKNAARPLPIGAACRIVADAAAGLDYAHKLRGAQGQPLGLIHRDVSPQNILVGFDGAVKLIDFGVAKALDRQQHTATGILKGKYPYMSPEQASGDEIDHRSDLFSLGIILWELLTRSRLFKGSSDMITIRRVRDCQVCPPREVNPELPPKVDQLVLGALARPPGERYPDAAAFRLAIEDFIVAEQLPASSAHLVSYLSGLYADRISKATDLSILDQLERLDELDRISGHSTDSRKSTPNSPDSPLPASIGEAKTRPGTVLLESPRPPRHRATRAGLFLGAAIALALGGGALLRLQNRPTEGANAQIEAKPISRSPPVRVPSFAFEVELDSDPRGAQVQIEGNAVGVTPLKVALENESAEVQVTRAGYEPLLLTLTAKDAPRAFVQLRKKRAKAKVSSRTLGIKTGR